MGGCSFERPCSGSLREDRTFLVDGLRYGRYIRRWYCAAGHSFYKVDEDERPARAAIRTVERRREREQTPTVQDAEGRPYTYPNGQHGKPFPTLLGQAAGGRRPSKRLNPLFVEWLMGLPIGWTDYAPLATPSSRRSPPAPTAC